MASVDRHRGAEAANSMCTGCAALPHVRDAAIAVVSHRAHLATLGASSPSARLYDEVAFVVGEGPCLIPTISDGFTTFLDLTDATEDRWPLYQSAMLAHPISAVTVIPIIMQARGVGALTLFHDDPTPLTGEPLATARLAAHLAQLPILDVIGQMRAANINAGGRQWRALQQTSRADVAQATGMLMAQLNLDSETALTRLRAHSFATATSTSQVARAIIDHTLRL